MSTAWKWPEDIAVEWIDDIHRPQYNNDLDPALGRAVAAGERPPLIRVWRAARQEGIAVSRKDVATEGGQAAQRQLEAEGLQVVVRQTGGTAVPQGEGVVHVSYLFPRTSAKVTTDDYYRALCTPLMAWLQGHGCNASTGELRGSYCDGKYNILVDGRKLVGTAQAWRGGLAGVRSARPGYVLAHASIVVDVDMAVATERINHFYELAGNPYRVELQTSTTLRACAPAWLVGQSAAEAADTVVRDLMGFYEQWLQTAKR
ncbi:hypothetical protein GCM10025857_30500 [Alicyclobacillus contaminans]|uniref:lipoate--protein ligase family protein n=1 Tax=Alicyclobacillus contaminans TaxID=392016 RepID=UPI0003F6E8B3|nr:hypothetical protein [Alicyclobacillus contaminans]GMA51693.1 hypothetical protein GCM10025857_30500 [Alicyclobacillus contaminans]